MNATKTTAKKRGTKSALLTSLLSLLLCVTMFVGTTFAWFTDTVTSGDNVIVAGNLDLEVTHVNASVKNAESIADATNLWNKDSSGNDILWEPGVVSYETFTVKNAGTLALTYKLLLNQLANGKYNTVVSTDASNGMSLKDVLYVHTVTGAAETTRPATKMAEDDKTIADLLSTDAAVLSGTLEAGKSSDALTVYIYWPTDSGNECNLQNGKYASDATAETVGKLWINLSVTATAAQYTKEADSFDNQYDAKAGGEAPVEEKTDILPIMLGTESDAVTKVNKETTVSTTGLEVTYPVGVLTNEASKKDAGVQDYTGAKQGMTYVSGELSDAATNSSITLSDGESAVQYELTLDAVKTDNDTLVKVVRTIDNGKTVKDIYHNGVKMEKADSASAPKANDKESYYYDAETGKLTLWVFHASPIDIVMTAGSKKVDNNPYLTFSSDAVFTLGYSSWCYAGYYGYLESSTNTTDWTNFKATTDYIMPSVTAVKNASDGKYYVYLRGKGGLTGTDFSYEYTQLAITNYTKSVDCSGNIMTLLDYSNPNAAQLTSHAFFHLFDGCTALRTAPSLPATALADDCYCAMFKGCSSLEAAPALPATTLASDCYACMFSGCSALVTAPKLSAAELPDNCYREMFSECKSLTNAPAILATAVEWQSFANMFSGCTSLSVIECEATDPDKFVTIPSGELPNAAVDSMFDGTPNADTIGTYGTPAAGKSYKIATPTTNGYLTFSSDGEFTLGLDEEACYATGLEASTDKETWSAFKANGDTMPSVTAVKNDLDNKYYVYLRGDGMTTLYGEENEEFTTLTLSGSSVDCSGNIMTLLDYDNADNVTMDAYAFACLFSGCTALKSAPTLPAEQLAVGCYGEMFDECTSLVEAPALPATQLAEYCYSGMFIECTSLVTAPELPATTLVDRCYYFMFAYCSSLNVVECESDDAEKFVTIPSTEGLDHPVYEMFVNTKNNLLVGTKSTPEAGESYMIEKAS